jgi:cytosine/creatinine deaminase
VLCALGRIYFLEISSFLLQQYPMPKNKDLEFMKIALDEAKKGLDEGGIPIGSVLVIDDKIIGSGHNRRVQSGNPILHGEMDALQNAGRLSAKDYQRATIYTTLSPCSMCSGTILLYKIPRVVMAENRTFLGAEDLLKENGVELINLDLPEASQMMKSFIDNNPTLWNEDIGV